jgi:signal transduction histidine kinase
MEDLQSHNLPPEAQSTLDEALLTLDAVAREKSEFVSVVTHELRIPMTSIKGYTDLLRAGTVGEVNPQQTEFLNVIRNNVERMSSLVSNLSDSSRIESGRLLLEPMRVSLREYVEGALESLRPRIEEKDLDVSLDVDEGLPPVHADPNRLAQILTNLVTNAVMYSPKGVTHGGPQGGAIEVKAVEEGGKIRLSVLDYGIGISEEDLGKIPSPFYRSEDPEVRQEQGWGLSLHVSKGLVALMGGVFGIESKFREGSTFWFTLPVDEKSPD